MKPDTCNCCKPPTGGTPVNINNRPGLSAIAYRVGTFSNFRQAMFQAISRSSEFRSLSTRQSDDYTITILELWAAISDILTFYQERIANEAFLRTARWRDSVLRMARMLGYELSPGSAATAYLSFTAEKGKQVQVPVGLRVQSVPEQDEKPQKYETLEAITVYDWLNQLQIFPVPIGVNPLAKGSTSAYLAAGEDGLVIAESLVADDRVLLFESGGSEPVEELTVRDLQIEHEHMRLCWSQPVQGAGWDMTTKAYKLVRSFRLFGYNAPESYPHADIDTTTKIIKKWKIQHIGTGSPSANNFAIAGNCQLHLDSRYDDIKVGTPLLLVDGTAQQKLLLVTAVDQEDKKLGPITDTVTRLTVTPSFSQIDDRRQVVVYELANPAISFWGYTYHDMISSATLYIPGKRIDAETIEIARPIEKNAYQTGYTVKLKDIEAGRQVILQNEEEKPVVATINRADISRAEIVFDAAAEDAETVFLLTIDKDSAQTITGLCSARLSSTLELTGLSHALSVTIGKVGPRTVTFTFSSTSVALTDAASELQTALQAADTDPVFTQATVLIQDNHLIVLPGVVDETIEFEKTTGDETTVVELGLDTDHVKALTGLLSGELDPVPAYTEMPPKVSVRIGPVGPQEIELDSTASTLADIAADLQSKLSMADIAPFFKYARVVKVLGKQLLIIPGMAGATHQDFLKLDLHLDSSVEMTRQSAVLMGNIALASHGETVSGEVLGDADPTIPFQNFQLKKNPVTFVPSSGEGGTQNTLQLFVNNVLWSEVDTLYGKCPTETVYTTRINNDAEMTVRFGDGVTGARPPRGRGNLMASYRQCLGVEGRVKANTLKTLLDRPKGLKAAINPQDADGGADPETLDNARKNAPATVRTFDRAVSLLDFEYLALSRSEVAKAKVTWVWNGASRAAHLTIAGQKGSLFLKTSLKRIHTSLTSQRDPNRQLLLDNYVQVPILVSATLKVAATYVASKVEKAARAALATALSFETLEFAQSIHLSDVYAILQNVSGVVSVDIDHFMFKQPAGMSDSDFEDFLDKRGIVRVSDGTAKTVQGHLQIYPARPNTGSSDPPVLAAEQAWVESLTQDITLILIGGLPD
jgi:uncharacterized phage protein gp47/JayE